MAATAQWAKVVKVRMQVGGFTDNPSAVNTENNLLIDMTNHPQKDVVEVDWYYDQTTNTFSATSFEEVTNYIYAVLDANDIVTAVEVVQEQKTDDRHIPTVADTSIVGMVYINGEYRTIEEATYIVLKQFTTANHWC